MNALPRVCLVSPALAAANNGNWHTARRWSRFLAGTARVQIMLAWDGTPFDALIALHARRSAESIERFHAAHPGAPVAVVLTGTDLYRDLPSDPSAQHSLECASHVVVLQDEGLLRLPPAARPKARSIVQSATRLVRGDAATGHVGLVAVGHLRDEKDPLTLMAAARLLPPASTIRIVHIGNALDDTLGAQARATMQQCPHYRWLGGLPQAVARRWVARSRALVHMSRMEGGANVVIEALRSQVPVLASRIDGNVGLLGRDYDGYFPVGDAPALAALMQRFAGDAHFARHLAAQCRAREPRFTPAAEASAVRALLADMLAGPAAQRQQPARGADTIGASPPHWDTAP
ncbi:MAG: TIGR04348 family glycosyltransferase [Burkholderiales bacterium]|nr:TIGR04348 family glycosyltransferase [Burkholderiales bacterium]MDE2628537.1 TIGR04348 family glycosyltransferase [Burkholderiales bacterium]